VSSLLLSGEGLAGSYFSVHVPIIFFHDTKQGGSKGFTSKHFANNKRVLLGFVNESDDQQGLKNRSASAIVPSVPVWLSIPNFLGACLK